MTIEPNELAKWIENEKLSWTTGDFKSQGCTIGQCIPPHFESYCKIFHPFEVTPDEPEILEPNKGYGEIVNLSFSTNANGEIAITETRKDGTVIDILESQKAREKEYLSKRWNSITWKMICDKHGLIFHNEISPQTFVDKFQQIGWQKNLRFPNEGYLPRALLITVLNILKKESSSEDIFIYQALPHAIMKDNVDPELVKCKFDEVLDYFDMDYIGYLYSADKSWIIFTDTDLKFTIVGGQKHLIDSFLTSDLEALECKITTRVDNYSDRVNKEIAASNISLPKVGRTWWQKLFSSK